ncbi:metallophosphoesterase family protein [Solibacillus sp. CAU 1738]|uniref:metallophosphoesterase family protein n=1 Tax=Solibacillus sp. CAU 1738 TaxID=3140363 RepID=UPI00325FEA69
MNIFVVSDIHGMYEPFQKILNYWDEESVLVILGDLIDRGEHSYEVVKKVMILKKQYGNKVIYIKGNHEQMLLDYLDNPTMNNERYFKNGGVETLKSFIQNMDEEAVSENANIMLTQYEKEINFLREGHLHYQIGNVLLTHAGFDSELEHWQNSIERDFIWIREHYRIENKTSLVNIFGHTPTRYIHESDDIWVSPCKTYIGIDGGCVYNGQLNALLINEQGEILNQFTVSNAVEVSV